MESAPAGSRILLRSRSYRDSATYPGSVSFRLNRCGYCISASNGPAGVLFSDGMTILATLGGVAVFLIVASIILSIVIPSYALAFATIYRTFEPKITRQETWIRFLEPESLDRLRSAAAWLPGTLSQEERKEAHKSAGDFGRDGPARPEERAWALLGWTI